MEMKGIHDYIVEIKEPFKDTFKTEGGLELYANKDFSAERLSNRIGIIKATPHLFKGIIKEGYQVLIDPTILYEQIYRGVKQESIHLLDREKMLFKIEPKLIILFRENENEEWKGFLNNLLAEPIIKNTKEITSEYIFTVEVKEEFIKGKAIVKYCNEEVKELGISKNDTIAINPFGGLSFWLNGKEYWWLRTNDVLAKYNK